MALDYETAHNNTTQLERAALEIGNLVAHKTLQQEVVLVGIVGGSATGKSGVVAPLLAHALEASTVIAEDSYCIGQTQSRATHGYSNLHTPEDYDPAKMRADLERLKQGYSVNAPVYSYEQRERLLGTKEITPEQVMLVEGCYLLQPAMRDIFDATLFINADDHSRFVRRLLRPRRNPSQSDTQRINDYVTMTYPSYYAETAPFARSADVVLDNPYAPTEYTRGVAVIEKYTSQDNEASMSRQSYWHESMTEQERLFVETDTKGVQVLTYVSDASMPAPVTFCVPQDEYHIDLSKVGYVPL